MSENIPRKVVTTRIVKEWIANLTDQIGKAAINDRIDLLKQGNFGDIDSVKSEPGLFEMRIDDPVTESILGNSRGKSWY